MISKAGSAGTTIAYPERRACAVFLVPCGAVMAVTAVFDRPPWAKHAPIIAVVAYLAVVTFASIWALYRGCRIGVRFDDQGVTVRNFFKVSRIGWHEISHFADGCYNVQGNKCWALTVVLHNRRTVAVNATARKTSASPEMLAAIGQIAGRYCIPTVLTGDPRTGDGLPPNPGSYPDPGGKPGLRRWDGKEWSPFLQADTASGGEGEEKPSEVWSPLPGSEAQWRDTGSVARGLGIWFAVLLAAAVITLAGTLALFNWGTNHHNNYTWSGLTFSVGLFELFFAIVCWGARKEPRKIDQASKAAAALAQTSDSTASSRDEPRFDA